MPVSEQQRNVALRYGNAYWYAHGRNDLVIGLMHDRDALLDADQFAAYNKRLAVAFYRGDTHHLPSVQETVAGFLAERDGTPLVG